MLPNHLKRYVVEQDYSRYTPVDQEVWRFIMRQLIDFLSQHAHPCYLDGLKKTGIEVDRIPEIAKMSEKLERFGWRAVPVSGFIPPAAFMELQALGYLPIASDMRSADHLTYTPAPDIVHEAAGHAPILIDPEYAGYLRAYAQVAKKAIIGHTDIDQYDAIRVLSDLKEDPHSTAEQIHQAEQHLTEVTRSITHLSEAAYLSRMNWWTAEYGLIGTLEAPKIFGAGLLSSVGEAKACFGPRVKKIPLTLECIQYSYDITEQQPQLFVTPSFGHLVTVLEELAAQMAYRKGGIEGLEKAKLAETVNTVELNSGVQISGRLKDYQQDGVNPVYLQFAGPSQLCLEGSELPGHGTRHHREGFGTPVGLLEGADKCLSQMNEQELAAVGVTVDRRTELKFVNGVRVAGKVTGWLRSPTGQLLVISFRDCTVTRAQEILFDPAWGLFDMAVGSQVVSVFGGPADRLSYGETSDFTAKVVPRKAWPENVLRKHRLYQELRELRVNAHSADAAKLYEALKQNFPEDWLLRVALVELAPQFPEASWKASVEEDLRRIGTRDVNAQQLIKDGLRILP